VSITRLLCPDPWASRRESPRAPPTSRINSLEAVTTYMVPGTILGVLGGS
jgi:hypothetical protein